MLEHLCGPIENVMAQMDDNLTELGNSTMAIAVRFFFGGRESRGWLATRPMPTQTPIISRSTARMVGCWSRQTVRRYVFSKAGDEHSTVWEAGYFNDRGRAFHEMFDRYLDDLLVAFSNGEEPPIHAHAPAEGHCSLHTRVLSNRSSLAARTATT